jgi:murein DD-endopeptidase MepM/ murein hydrolase activator NlpD
MQCKTPRSLPARAALSTVGLLGALLLYVLAAGPARAQRPTPIISTPTPQPTATPTPFDLRARLALTPGALESGQIIFLPLILNSSAGDLDANPDSFTYTVQPDDTLWSLAIEFSRDLDTMSCATTPTGRDADELLPGQTITVPALDDLCYTVTPYDTLPGIAAKHKLSVQEIVAVPWNGFTSPPYSIKARQRILLPGARAEAKPRPERSSVSFATDAMSKTSYPDWPYGDGHFIWPVTGWISQGYRPGHWAIDIATPLGTPVKAVDRGKVIKAGWNPTGYGFRVVIDHGIDYVTLYGHLQDIYVKEGETVGKGQVIGLSGSNGNITGPHLHFEIRDYGYLVDPLKLLPKR